MHEVENTENNSQVWYFMVYCGSKIPDNSDQIP